MGGWTGKLLRVNLTDGTSAVESIPREWLKQYIGGRGLAARYLYDEMDPRAEPLSPENKLIFATGPLTGTPAPCGAGPGKWAPTTSPPSSTPRARPAIRKA